MFAAKEEQNKEEECFEVGSVYYFIACCPRGDNGKCNKGSFKKAEVWGLTEESCLAQLKKHYTNSSLHYKDFEDSAELGADVEIAGQ